MRQSFYAGHGIRLIEKSTVVVKAEHRSWNRGNVVGRVLMGVRSVVTFLFVATMFVFLFCHSTKLQNVIIAKLYKWHQTELKTDTLRQTALKHEIEVNGAAQ
jgi:hypothetical protein